MTMAHLLLNTIFPFSCEKQLGEGKLERPQTLKQMKEFNSLTLEDADI